MAQTTEKPAFTEEPTDLLSAKTLNNSSKATSRADRHQSNPDSTHVTAADAPAAPQEHSQQQGPKGRKLLVILHGQRLDDDTLRNAILVGARTGKWLTTAGNGSTPYSVQLVQMCKRCSQAVSYYDMACCVLYCAAAPVCAETQS
jgi:hypothetical protein